MLPCTNQNPFLCIVSGIICIYHRKATHQLVYCIEQCYCSCCNNLLSLQYLKRETINDYYFILLSLLRLILLLQFRGFRQFPPRTPCHEIMTSKSIFYQSVVWPSHINHSSRRAVTYIWPHFFSNCTCFVASFITCSRPHAHRWHHEPGIHRYDIDSILS